jgi:3-methyladenine DNA glycosylase AlkD
LRANHGTVLLQALRCAFAAHADGDAAAAMQRYMKSAMPFHGLKTPLRRRLCAEVFAQHRLATPAALRDAMLHLWRHATHREERYAAIELPGWRAHRTLETSALLPAYEEMISTGAWWDYCDAISGERLRALLEREPGVLKPQLLRWAAGPDLWLARAAMLCQRGLRARCDAPLLYACILPSLDSPEFFLRKAIGWALRERAYTAPEEVRAFCTHYAARLSPLSRREALRALARR